LPFIKVLAKFCRDIVLLWHKDLGQNGRDGGDDGGDVRDRDCLLLGEIYTFHSSFALDRVEFQFLFL
jgi:hypothetical protein